MGWENRIRRCFRKRASAFAWLRAFHQYWGSRYLRIYVENNYYNARAPLFMCSSFICIVKSTCSMYSHTSNHIHACSQKLGTIPWEQRRSWRCPLGRWQTWASCLQLVLHSRSRLFRLCGINVYTLLEPIEWSHFNEWVNQMNHSRWIPCIDIIIIFLVGNSVIIKKWCMWGLPAPIQH